MQVEFDMAGKRHQAELVKKNAKTIHVEVSYDYTRRHSDGESALGLRKYKTVRFKGHRVISRHIDKHNVAFLDKAP